MLAAVNNPDALPQLLGEFRPVDEWQAHINELFYGLRRARLRDYYQTFAAADHRLGHALAAHYYEAVRKRDKGQGGSRTLTIVELGCGNGNLAGTFLSHLRTLDRDQQVYPRVRYLIVDRQSASLADALKHPDVEAHRDRVETLCGDVQCLAALKDGSVDRIMCNELWNDLPTKLMLRDGTEIHEEFIRPNLNELRSAEITDWSGFVRAFDGKDVAALGPFPPFLDDLVWEKEYRKCDWAAIPYRKTINDFMKRIDEKVLVPVNIGACATIKEAKRLLTPNAIGFSSFDAGTSDMAVLNDPDKPCYGQFGGQYSFVVNFTLIEAVAHHIGLKMSEVEAQKEFVGRSLRTNVMSLMDLLATHPTSHSLKGWEQDRLILQTIRALNETYESPHHRRLNFPLSNEIPAEDRETLQGILTSLKPNGVPDTIAYVTEEELLRAERDLEGIGYDPDAIRAALLAPPQPIDYYHHFVRQ